MAFIKPFEVPQEVLFNSQVLFQQIFKLRRSGCQGLREDNKSLFIMEKNVAITIPSTCFKYHHTYLYSGSVNKDH